VKDFSHIKKPGQQSTSWLHRSFAKHYRWEIDAIITARKFQNDTIMITQEAGNKTMALLATMLDDKKRGCMK